MVVTAVVIPSLTEWVSRLAVGVSSTMRTVNVPLAVAGVLLISCQPSNPCWKPLLANVPLLLEDHRRVRGAARSSGEYRVTPSLLVDVMGVFVLVPA
jgi:hypothetical protein